MDTKNNTNNSITFYLENNPVMYINNDVKTNEDSINDYGSHSISFEFSKNTSSWD